MQSSPKIPAAASVAATASSPSSLGPSPRIIKKKDAPLPEIPSEYSNIDEVREEVKALEAAAAAAETKPGEKIVQEIQVTTTLTTEKEKKVDDVKAAAAAKEDEDAMKRLRMEQEDKKRRLTEDIYEGLKSIKVLTNEHMKAKGLPLGEGENADADAAGRNRVEVTKRVTREEFLFGTKNKEEEEEEKKEDGKNAEDGHTYASLGVTFRDLTAKMRDAVDDIKKNDEELKYIDETDVEEEEAGLDSAILEASGLAKEEKVQVIELTREDENKK